MEQSGAVIQPIKVYSDKYADQVVLVTGSAQGIGEATATLFAAQRPSVVLVDVNGEHLGATESKLRSGGAQVTSRVCDLGVEEQVTCMVDEVRSTLGKIDVLVHLAGVYPFRALLDSTSADYHHIMKVNTDSCFFLTRAVLPHMQKAGYGRIINTASGTILHPEADLALYAAAKSAVAGLTRSTAVEAGPGVTANVVCPGLIMTDTTWSSAASKPIFDKSLAKQCVKRYGHSRDVAHTINFIASPEAEFITGQLFDISGGATFS